MSSAEEVAAVESSDSSPSRRTSSYQGREIDRQRGQLQALQQELLDLRRRLEVVEAAQQGGRNRLRQLLGQIFLALRLRLQE